MFEISWTFVAAVVISVFAAVGLIMIVLGLLRSRRDEWNKGRRQVGKDFSSIWNDQQRHFQQSVRDFEHEINRRMVEAAQASRTQSDPLLADFDELMKKHKDGGPPAPPALKEREVGGSGNF